MKQLVNVFLLCYVAQTVWGSTRHDRIWPVSGSDTVDLGQSSPFGPRLKFSEGSRYDFHRGVDIPTPDRTPLYAIDDGKVKIAGSHPRYSDGVVQLEHTGWEESSVKFYSNYLHIIDSTVQLNQQVSKGDLIAYSWHSVSGFEHLHFEIRVGRRYQRNCCNPWKYLPNADNDYSTFTANVILTPNFNGESCQAVVNVFVPPDQLTFNRIELHIDNGQTTETRDYDMCEDNLTHSFSEMEDPYFEDYLIISPKRFSSMSYPQGEWAGYGFEFYDLPATSGSGGTVTAQAFDVFGNSVTTSQASYSC